MKPSRKPRLRQIVDFRLSHQTACTECISTRLTVTGTRWYWVPEICIQKFLGADLGLGDLPWKTITLGSSIQSSITPFGIASHHRSWGSPKLDRHLRCGVEQAEEMIVSKAALGSSDLLGRRLIKAARARYPPQLSRL